jgi:ERF superfamily
MKALVKIQSELKANKSNFNKFGNYSYRSAEDILEALKPLLLKHECILTLNDDILLVGNRFYVKATATILCEESTLSVSAFAREEETKKGMDGAQVTGSASSYARKYALNGLFAIDDTKDSDATNTHGKEQESKQAIAQQTQESKQATVQQIKIINDLIAQKGVDLQKFLTAYKIFEVSEIGFADAQKAITQLTNK